MITAERTYQANSKVITTADNMLSTLVNMPQG
jgi:flagellar hook protein FlgE